MHSPHALRPTRVVEVSSHAPPHLGGVEIVVQRLFDGLASRGYDVRWCSSDYQAKPGRVPMHGFMPFKRWGNDATLWSPSSFVTLAKEIAACDVVHIHDHTHPGSFVAAVLGKLLGKKLVVTTHVNLRNHTELSYIRWIVTAYRFACRSIVFRLADAATAVSRAAALSLPHPWNERALVIVNGVDTGVFRRADESTRAGLRHGFGWNDDSFVCLFSGRFVHAKGLPMLRDLASKRPDWIFCFVGSGIIDPSSWKLPNVRVMDSTRDPATLARYYQAADAFVFPSVSEGLSLSLVEALSCGLPCFTTPDVAAAVDNSNCFPVKAADGGTATVADWERAVETTRSLDRAETSMRWNSWEDMCDGYAAVLANGVSPVHTSIDMHVSFVIPAHNEEKRIAECLKSIIDLRDPWVHEIVVVDNASTDKTAEIAGSFPGVRVVREDRKGVTFARQKGLETITGDLYAAVDADARVSRAWLEKVKARFSADPDLVCLVGAYDYYDLAPWKKRLKSALETTLAAARSLLGKTYVAAYGGNTVYKASVLRDVGGFDVGMTYYGEDLALVLRMREAGKTIHDPTLVAPASARRFNAEGFFRVLLLNKCNAVWQNLLRKPLLRGGERDWR